MADVAASDAIINFMSLNVRGLMSELSSGSLLKVMCEYKVAVACFMETRLVSQDPSRSLPVAYSHYYWVSCSNLKPSASGTAPRRVLGILVDGRILPGAVVVPDGMGEHTCWVTLPSRSSSPDVFLCLVHMHGPEHKAKRAAAFNEIKAGVVKYRSKGILMLMGDFNSRCAMNGDDILLGSGRELMDYCDDETLVIINALDVCEGSFTRVEERERTVIETTVDYMIIDSQCEERAVNMTIVEDADLDSDHRPLILGLEWPVGPINVIAPKAALKRRYKINGSAPKILNSFEGVVEPMMVDLDVQIKSPQAPHDQMSIDQCVKDLVLALDSAAQDHFGVKLVGPKSKPWFDSEVASMFRSKVAARVALNNLTSSGADPGLVALARQTLSDVKSNLKVLVRAKSKARERSAHYEIERAQGTSKLFWSRWKARVGQLSTRGGPSAIRDSDGTVTTDPIKVLKAWKDYTESLGKEEPIYSHTERIGCDASRYDDDFATAILSELRASLDQDGSLSELESPITWEEVHTAVRHLKPGKSPGPDGLPNELLRVAGLGFEIVLADLFNEIWTNMLWPTEWRVANLIPLYKAGDRLDPGNYRLLAMMSTLPKVFEKVLDARIRAWSERVGALTDLQGGFRDGRGTPDQAFILNELITSRIERDQPTYTAFIDVAKAYDRMWRPGLWWKLERSGLSDQTLDVVRLMYRRVVRKVMIGGNVSGEFTVESGTPQGSVLSPYLYAKYINGLHEALRERGLGVLVAGSLVPLLLFADDIVLLARSEADLAASLQVIEHYAKQWRFDFNNNKSNVVVFGADPAIARSAASRQWMLSGCPVKVVDSYKYLGLDFCNGRQRGKWNSYLARIYTKARAGIALMMWQGGGASGLRPRTMVHLFKSLCRPLLEYGCELWEGEASATWDAELETLQYRFGCSVLGTKAHPASVAVLAELGLSSLKSRRQSNKLVYWQKLCEADPDRLLSRIFRSRYRDVQRGGGRFSCLNSFKSTFGTVGLAAYWNECRACDDWSGRVRGAVSCHHALQQQSTVARLPSLTLYRTLGHCHLDGTHPYLDDRSNLHGTRLKGYLRCGVLWLMPRVASSLNWAPVAGRCLLCRSGELESPEHLLMCCGRLQRHRSDLKAVLTSVLAQAGFAGDMLLRVFCTAMSLDPARAVALIAGARLDIPCPMDTVPGVHREQCGKAMWLLDKVSKNYLVRIMKARKAIMGSVSVEKGRLVHHPRSGPNTFSDPNISGHVLGAKFRGDWLRWAPAAAGDALSPSSRRTGPNKPFYVVWVGRQTGVFYRYCDVLRSVAGVKDRKFMGFESLDEAYRAHELGSP